jgi:cytochrome c oxidase subunit 2
MIFGLRRRDGRPDMFSGFPLFPPQASTFAARVDALYFFLIAISAFFSTLIATLLVVFAVRYRRRRAGELPRPIHGSIALELVWTIIPLVISLGTFVWSADIFVASRRVPPGAMEVYVVGKRWMWKTQHMTGQREINELHVPIGVPVKLTMTSEDVIHSFFIPAFRVKQDAGPGRYTTAWFEATKAGEYHLFCAEYCGTKHSQMIGSIKVMEPAAFQTWLAGAPRGLARPGRREAVPVPGLHHLPSRGLAGTRARAWKGCSEDGPAHGRGDGGGGRRLHPRVDPQSDGEGRGRVPADHADLPGAGERRRRDAAHRLHPVAAAAGRGDDRGASRGR